MTVATSSTAPSPARVPASTIRCLQRFYGYTRAQMADLFQVHERTVLRWEQRGALPASLPIDPTATHDPDWRPKLLLWLVDLYEKRGVSDNRKKEGPCPDPAP